MLSSLVLKPYTNSMQLYHLSLEFQQSNKLASGLPIYHEEFSWNWAFPILQANYKLLKLLKEFSELLLFDSLSSHLPPNFRKLKIQSPPTTILHNINMWLLLHLIPPMFRGPCLCPVYRLVLFEVLMRSITFWYLYPV